MEFDKNKIGSGVTLFASQGKGFYFTARESVAEKYSRGGRVLSSYLKANNLFSFVDKKSKNVNSLLDEFARLNGGKFDVNQYSDFVDFEGTIQSPWCEHLMQRFSHAFIRIGLSDPTKRDFEDVITKCYSEVAT